MLEQSKQDLANIEAKTVSKLDPHKLAKHKAKINRLKRKSLDMSLNWKLLFGGRKLLFLLKRQHPQPGWIFAVQAYIRQKMPRAATVAVASLPRPRRGVAWPGGVAWTLGRHLFLF